MGQKHHYFYIFQPLCSASSVVVYSGNIGVPSFREIQNARIHLYQERLWIYVTECCSWLNDIFVYKLFFFLLVISFKVPWDMYVIGIVIKIVSRLDNEGSETLPSLQSSWVELIGEHKSSTAVFSFSSPRGQGTMSYKVASPTLRICS